MADGIEHFSDLLISPLDQGDTEPRVCITVFKPLDLLGLCASSILEHHAASQTLNEGIRWNALNLGFVNLRNVIACGSDVIRQLAIVCQDQQTFGVEIQSPDRVQSTKRMRYKFSD